MKFRTGLSVALFMIFLISIPLFASDYWITLLTLILIFTVYSAGWNLFSGLTGYTNFGLAWFIGLGGYVSSLLIADGRVFWLLAWPTGAIFTSLVSIGVPTADDWPGVMPQVTVGSMVAASMRTTSSKRASGSERTDSQYAVARSHAGAGGAKGRPRR